VASYARNKESVTQPDYGSQFQYNKMTAMNVPKEKKLQEDGIKSGRTEQSGINLKNTALQPAGNHVKHLRLDQQEEKSIRASTRKALKRNNKRYQENPQLYRTRQEINEHIFGTIKGNGVTITLI
jgi:hypothetical protein